MYYVLVNIETQNSCVTFDSFAKAQAAYYRQWRRQDGSIPWRIVCAQYELDPRNGHVVASDL